MSRQISYTRKISSIKKKEREIYSNILNSTHIWQVEGKKNVARASPLFETHRLKRSGKCSETPLSWQKPSLLVRQDNYSAERSALRSFRRGNTCSQFSATRGIYAHGERYIHIPICSVSGHVVREPLSLANGYSFSRPSLLSLSLSSPPRDSSPLQIIRYALRKRVNDALHTS